MSISTRRWSRLRNEARVVAAAVAFLLAGAASAQPRESTAVANSGRKPAWQWALDERLAARFNPAAMKARAAQDAAGRERAAAQFGERFDAEADQHSINGRREPELLLPSEVFRNLISRAFPEDGQGQGEVRRRFEEGAAVLGFGSDFWVRLETVAAPYLKVRNDRYQRAMAALARSEAPESSESDELAHCRSLAQALNEAKAEFGDELFLRLLYQEVAPTMAITYSVDEGTRDRLRSQEGGCR